MVKDEEEVVKDEAEEEEEEEEDEEEVVEAVLGSVDGRRAVGTRVSALNV